MHYSSESLVFTPWRSLGANTSFSDRSLAETLDGGQAFRWRLNESGSWTGIWGQNLVEVCLQGERLEWRRPKQVSVNREEVLRYFAFDPPYEEIIDELPWRSDRFLANAMERFHGLRILRQPLGEALFAFLLSTVKSIPQIKELCELTAKKYGEEIVPGIYALPTWERLARVSEKELRALKLGYRAKYVTQTARMLAEEPDFFSEVEEATYEQARGKLMKLPGVGGKVADCALLFGAGKREAFPVDTWIAKVMASGYGLKDWRLEQVAAFGRAHFGRFAGLAQQFLFSAVREKQQGTKA
ncbi:MAG: DNA-binding protein [Opitutae bacterium]|nr:DNA-binding protein [Opitutae bacterium]